MEVDEMGFEQAAKEFTEVDFGQQAKRFAEDNKRIYEAHIKAGFTKDEAMQILIAALRRTKVA